MEKFFKISVFLGDSQIISSTSPNYLVNGIN